MGHLINPIRYRLGNSIFWANNWPAKEKNRYFLSYEIHQEMDQYFKTLFHFFRKLKMKRRRKGGKKILRKIRHPKLYFSNVNVNLFGLNADQLMVDVNIYDFFLDNYLEDVLSSETNDTSTTNLSKFLNKFNRYVGFEFFFRHKRILQKLTKNQFSAVLNVCRKKVEIFEQIAINKIQIFIEIYVEFIRRSLFSFYNDKKNIFNCSKSLFSKEKRLLSKLSFFKRIDLIHKYWTKKYNNIGLNSGSLLTFSKYFTSEFYNLATHKKQQNNTIQQKIRSDLAKKSYKIELDNFLTETKFRNDLVSFVFPERVVNKYQKEIQKTNVVSTHPGSFRSGDNTYRTFPRELPVYNHLDKYLGDSMRFHKDLFQKKNNLPVYSNSLKFIDDFCTTETITFLLYLKKWLITNNKEEITNIVNLLIKYIQQIQLEKTTKLILDPNFKLIFKQFLIIFKNLIHIPFFSLFQQFYKDLLKFKALYYQYIKQTIKKNSTYFLKYNIDPFYEKYLEYKQLQNIYLNINVGIGPEEDTDHDVIDARFLTLYIKRLFKRNRFKVAELARTMQRSLSKLPYIDGFVIIFAGRFTRRESKIHKVTKKGVFHYGAISKLVDYHTIGFTSKFGYCGVKVFIQYKAKWPTIEEQRNKRSIFFEKKFQPSTFQTTKDTLTSNKLITNKIEINSSSKRYTRLVQKLFSQNQIPYYNNG
uniref:ribosomal protein S3 n=1 Tax=Thecamoeba quadrilineata TaxID=343530 RepID=UPI00226CC199|nr:ribosomal protein S3 [Thecamoeba quadrilineata]UZN43819.1 ribosomal protein S3 [Thecamoeba quadrilineata]